MNLEENREMINKIDKELTKLFERRMDIVIEVARYKERNNIPILDKNRELLVIGQNIENLINKEYSKYLEVFYTTLMEISKDYQKTLFNNPEKIGYQGVRGSFGHKAARFFIENEEGSEIIPFPEFLDIFNALEDNIIDYGVLPVENSSTGIINKNYDLLQKSRLYIVNEIVIKAKQNLLGVKGSRISDIKKVYSHIQGFEQSSIFLEKHKQWELIPYYNTATSAKYISKINNKSFGAIASEEAAKIYNLDILKENINDNTNNFTRFIKISKNLDLDERNDKISLVFSIKNKRNSLLDILNILSNYSVNMLNLQSRPIQNKPWEYLFYLDLEGNIIDKNIKICLMEIEEKTLFYRLLGCYSREVF